jgi:predicted negative regulator of RcsB-dependent stress response
VEDYLSEKEQWEQLKGWIRENGLWVIAGVAVGAAALSGFGWYRNHTDQVGGEASMKYNQSLDAFKKGDRAEAFRLLGELERDYASSPYVDQLKLSAARVYVEDGELDKAATELRGAAGHTKDAELATIAQLRLARVQIAQKKPDEALSTLNAIKPGAFDPRLHEIRGDALYAKGDKSGALKEYRSAKSGDFERSFDNPDLDLKISDLSADLPPPVAQQTLPPPTAAAK